MSDRSDFRILSLDGGGSKGVYTLGVLKEIEALTKRSLHEEFDLIYGTSTGSIIASLIALEENIEQISETYFKIIPDVMKHKTPRGRSDALARHAKNVFQEKKFDQFKTDIGIVATNFEYEKPMIFKSSLSQAHGMKNTFTPGFGCTISEAVVSSCSAFPFFPKNKVQTENQGESILIDGGFVANNPTLFAIADAVKAYGKEKSQIKVLSIGVGIYNEPQRKLYYDILFKFWPFYLIPKMLNSSTNTIEQLRYVLFPDIPCVRINESFPQKEYETDLLESDIEKLQKIQTLGRSSFGKYEKDVKSTFGW